MSVAMVPLWSGSAFAPYTLNTVVVITNSPSEYNSLIKIYEKSGNSIYSFIDVESSSLPYDDQQIIVHYALVGGGRLISTTYPDIAKLNNLMRYDALHNTDLYDVYLRSGFDGCPITEEICAQYSASAYELIDEFRSLYLGGLNHNDHSDLELAKTPRGKLNTLTNAMIDTPIDKLELDDTYEVVDLMLHTTLRFAAIRAMKKGVFVFDKWGAFTNFPLLSGLLSEPLNHKDVLRHFVTETLEGLANDLIEYQNKDGCQDSNIISFDGGKTFYDVINKTTFREF